MTHSTVVVLYAGSLVQLMTQSITPAYNRGSGDQLQGYPGGSVALANEIKGKLIQADVFISAEPSVNESLMGSANGGWVTWYATFAKAPLVIGYNPSSRFASLFKSEPWYQVLTTPGFLLGRTDPTLDPKGVLTIQVVQREAQLLHRPGLVNQMLGAAENPAQIFPEQELVGRLLTGQLDGAFFYQNEAVQAKIPYITLPATVDLSALYTATVLHGARHPAAAAALVAFLYSPQGQALMRASGLSPVAPTLTGRLSAVPSSLNHLFHR
ncbi:MAG: extracellular solute-binding protein [Sulfobacillus sp.]